MSETTTTVEPEEQQVLDAEVVSVESASVPAPSRALRKATPMQMIDRALSQNADVAVIEKLMELQERWEANQARKAFEKAMAAAKAALPVIPKDQHVSFKSKNPGAASTDYWHEDLAGIAKVVDPVLAKHGLNYRFRTAQDGDKITLTCIIAHRDGHQEENSLTGGPDATGNKNPHQAISSAVTYLQRYTLKPALGLAAGKDDDGRAAGATTEPEKITDAQVDELIKLADEVGASKKLFCEYFEIDGFPDILAVDFEGAKARLEEKRAKKMEMADD